jgi:phosphonate transport system substrate-binding protein
VTVLIFVAPEGTASHHGNQPFRVGFSRSLFTNVNEADARASIKVWAQTVARERQIAMDTTAHLYTGTTEMVEAMQQGAVDVISLTFPEYLELAAEVDISLWFATRSAGELFEKYILLVQEDAGFLHFEDLKGRTIVLHDSARTNLATDWLDHLVMRHGHDVKAKNFFDAIQRVAKVSSAVLPVFFGKADATVVAESDFKTMCELNPQLRAKLREIAGSPPLLPAIMCFRKDFESPEKQRIINALSELHTTAAGRQVLTLFQSEALVQVEEEALKGTEAFFLETRRMRDGRASDDVVSR